MVPGHNKTALPLLALLCGWASVACAGEPVYRPADLTRMSWPDLECIYRQAELGRTPNGFARGRVVYCPDTFLAGVKSGAARVLWKGKHFDAGEGTLVNQWCGFRAIRATVCHGTSWLDGKPAIVLDYSATSRAWSDVRDECGKSRPACTSERCICAAARSRNSSCFSS